MRSIGSHHIRFSCMDSNRSQAVSYTEIMGLRYKEYLKQKDEIDKRIASDYGLEQD